LTPSRLRSPASRLWVLPRGPDPASGPGHMPLARPQEGSLSAARESGLRRCDACVGFTSVSQVTAVPAVALPCLFQFPAPLPPLFPLLAPLQPSSLEPGSPCQQPSGGLGRGLGTATMAESPLTSS
uniref:Uncharacterized protein n=1 Tax=Ursus maritimus TaxID=29073 RepID=A0A452TUW7_URSMA